MGEHRQTYKLMKIDFNLPIEFFLNYSKHNYKRIIIFII